MSRRAPDKVPLIYRRSGPPRRLSRPSYPRRTRSDLAPTGSRRSIRRQCGAIAYSSIRRRWKPARGVAARLSSCVYLVAGLAPVSTEVRVNVACQPYESAEAVGGV
jgi:hypothetical protein